MASTGLSQWRPAAELVDHLGLIQQIDALYESVVNDPRAWGDVAFAEWAGDVTAATVVPKDVGRELRRSIRVAQKLQAFWTQPPHGAGIDDVGDWRSKVDLALGARAWRPTLDLARLGLEQDPSEDLFEEVKARFRVVHSDRWMEGVDFEVWRAAHGSEG